MQATLKLLSIYSIEIRSTSWTTQSGHPKKKKKEKKAKKKANKKPTWAELWLLSLNSFISPSVWGCQCCCCCCCLLAKLGQQQQKKKKKEKNNSAQLGEIFFDTSFKLKIVEDAKYNCQSPLRFLLFVPLCVSGVCVCVWQTCQIKLFLPSYGTALATN